MQGLHLTADLHNCRCEPGWMLDPVQLGPWCAAAARTHGLQPLDQLAHAFAAPDGAVGGTSVTLLIAGSHVAVHAWARNRAVTLDVYVCNTTADHTARAKALMETLIGRFAPEWTEQRSLDRGDEA